MNHSPVIQDVDPTPDFYQRSIDLLHRWQNGELPLENTLAGMAQLNQEAQRSGHLANQGRIEQILGVVQSYIGNLNTSIHHYERSRALFSEVGNRLRIAICDLNMGEVYRYKGDFNRARALFERAYDMSEELGDRSNMAYALGNKGQMLLSMGQLQAARVDLEAAYHITLEFPPDSDERTELHCEILMALASLHLRTGDIDSAWNEAQQSHTIAASTPKPLARGFANRAVAEVLTMRENPPENGFDPDPDTYYTAANDAFREINAEGEMARTMFAQARSLARRGRRMTAARKLQHAMIIFTRLGMVDDAARAAEAQLEVL